MTADLYETVEEVSATFTTGPGPASDSVAPVLVSVEAGPLGDRTDDCTVGTHYPRDLTVVVDVSAAEPWSRIELWNRDLRTWVSQPVDGPGELVLDVYQPVQSELSDRTDCFTATLVSPSGAGAESEELCLETRGEDRDGCGCRHTTPTGGWLLLGPLLVLGRRRGTAR